MNALGIQTILHEVPYIITRCEIKQYSFVNEEGNLFLSAFIPREFL